MENFPNFLNDTPDPKERKFIKKYGLQNYRNWLINKCGPNIRKKLSIIKKIILIFHKLFVIYIFF